MLDRNTYPRQLYLKAKSKLPKVDGKHCIICRKELPKFKRKYCSNGCIDKWYNELNIPSWETVRWQAFKRDNYTCQLCKKQFMKDGYPFGTDQLECDHLIPVCMVMEVFHTKKEMSIEDVWRKKIYSIENLRTLCKECHKIVTASLFRKLANRHGLLDRQLRNKSCPLNLVDSWLSIIDKQWYYRQLDLFL